MPAQTNIQLLLPIVHERLAECLASSAGIILQSLTIQNVIHRPFSQIVFLTADTSMGPQTYVMKKVVHHSMNISLTKKENQSVVEYNMLQKLFSPFDEIKGCSVPEPVLVIPELEVYMMKLVNGTLLMDKFKYSRFFSSKQKYQELLIDIEMCGRWVKFFHKFTGIKPADSNSINAVLQRAEHRLKLIEESDDNRIPSGFRGMASGFIEKQCKSIKVSDVYIAGRHGDFTPLNVMTGDSGITVIDFLGSQNDLIMVDLLKFLIFLEDEQRSFTSSNSRVKEMRSSFLKGYGKLRFVESSKPAILVCEAMQRIVSLWGQISSEGSYFHHKIEKNWRIKNHIQWFLSVRNS